MWDIYYTCIHLSKLQPKLVNKANMMETPAYSRAFSHKIAPTLPSETHPGCWRPSTSLRKMPHFSTSWREKKKRRKSAFALRSSDVIEFLTKENPDGRHLLSKARE